MALTMLRLTSSASLRPAPTQTSAVRLARLGKVVSGPDLGRYVFVRTDALRTGGYLVISSAGQNLEESCDTWVESRAALEQHFARCAWEVDWQE